MDKIDFALAGLGTIYWSWLYFVLWYKSVSDNQLCLMWEETIWCHTDIISFVIHCNPTPSKELFCLLQVLAIAVGLFRNGSHPHFLDMNDATLLKDPNLIFHLIRSGVVFVCVCCVEVSMQLTGLLRIVLRARIVINAGYLHNNNYQLLSRPKLSCRYIFSLS